MPTDIEQVITQLFGPKLDSCTDFELAVASASCINRQLIAMVQIAGKGGGKQVSGATVYAVHSEVAGDSRAFGAVIGPPMGSAATFNLPFSLTASLFPFDKKGVNQVVIIVELYTPGSDTPCYLKKEVFVN
jgi:hypothetical protein